MPSHNHLKQLLRYERKLILCAKQSQRRIISPEYQGRTLTGFDADQLRRDISFWGSPKTGASWKKALSDAEKIVGSPGSFMSLRCLLSDELSNIAVQMRKLVGTGHPLLEIARKFLFDGNHSMQMRGLLVLLVSKAAGQPFDHCRDLDATTSTANQEMESGIYPRQRIIAEITEMIHTAKMIHLGVVEMKRNDPDHPTNSVESLRLEQTHLDEDDSDMVFGNKIAVLSGDFLLANVSSSLAEVKNAKVVEIMSSAITDLTEAEFTEPPSDQPRRNPHDPQMTSCTPSEGLQRTPSSSSSSASGGGVLSSSTPPSTSASSMASATSGAGGGTGDLGRPLTSPVAAWRRRAFLCSGSLIAKSLQAAMLLANHTEEFQKRTFQFGELIGQSLQICDELQSYTSNISNLNNAFSLPVALECERLGNLEPLEIAQYGTMDQQKRLHHSLKASPSLTEARRMASEYSSEALTTLEFLPASSQAATALRNMSRHIVHI